MFSKDKIDNLTGSPKVANWVYWTLVSLAGAAVLGLGFLSLRANLQNLSIEAKADFGSLKEELGGTINRARKNYDNAANLSKVEPVQAFKEKVLEEINKKQAGQASEGQVKPPAWKNFTSTMGFTLNYPEDWLITETFDRVYLEKELIEGGDRLVISPKEVNGSLKYEPFTFAGQPAETVVYNNRTLINFKNLNLQIFYTALDPENLQLFQQVLETFKFTK